jgi:hypothetical protein
MAQGHYPVRLDPSGLERLKRSPTLAELFDEEGSAVRVLPGRSIGEARALIERAARR